MENIRDRIVVGILDKDLSQRQMDPNLNLEMAVLEAQKSEEVKTQVSQQGEQAGAIEEVEQGHGMSAKSKWQHQQRDRYQDCDSHRRKCMGSASVYGVSISEQEFGQLRTQPVKIVLQEKGQAYAVCTARRVPIPLLVAVKEQLGWMEANNIIEDRQKSLEKHASLA